MEGEGLDNSSESWRVRGLITGGGDKADEWGVPGEGSVFSLTGMIAAILRFIEEDQSLVPA